MHRLEVEEKPEKAAAKSPQSGAEQGGPSVTDSNVQRDIVATYKNVVPAAFLNIVAISALWNVADIAASVHSLDPKCAELKINAKSLADIRPEGDAFGERQQQSVLREISKDAVPELLADAKTRFGRAPSGKGRKIMMSIAQPFELDESAKSALESAETTKFLGEWGAALQKAAKVTETDLKKRVTHFNWKNAEFKSATDDDDADDDDDDELGDDADEDADELDEDADELDDDADELDDDADAVDNAEQEKDHAHAKKSKVKAYFYFPKVCVCDFLLCLLFLC
jgi:hypothetical protein